MTGAGILFDRAVASLRSAFRSTRRRPAFFVIATLSLGLALGICSAAFTLVDAVTHPSVPYAHPERTIWTTQPVTGLDRATIVAEQVRAMRELPEFEEVTTFDVGSPANISLADSYDRPAVVHVAPNFFRAIGVRPSLGRDFSEGDDRSSDVAIVSEAFWRQAHRGERTVAGATLELDGRVYSIVGVVPSGVQIPRSDARIWTLLSPGETAVLFVGARLRADVSLERAQNVLNGLAARLTSSLSPSKPLSITAHLVAGKRIRAGAGQAMMLLMAAFILLIACSNVAAMTLARTVTQHRDLAVRLALGASTRTLIASQLAEAALIAVTGGLIGVPVGQFGAALFAAGMPPQFVGAAVVFEPHVSVRVFVFMFGAIIATMVFATLLPASRLARIQPIDPIKESAGTTTGRPMRRLRELVFLELALTTVLLVMASLSARSAAEVDDFDLGFDSAPLRLVGGFLPHLADTVVFGSRGAEAALLERLRVVPGVVGATTFSLRVPHDPSVNSEQTIAAGAPLYRIARALGGPGMLQVLGLPLVAGRDFADGDMSGDGVAIIDQRVANALFPGRKAIGEHVRVDYAYGNGRPDVRWVTVVGVTRNANLAFPNVATDVAKGAVFTSGRARVPQMWNIVVRLDPHVPQATANIHRVLRNTLPPSSLSDLTIYSRDMELARSAVSFIEYTIGTLAFGALALAAVGVFGVISYMVGQRMREFGVRIALGARSPAILGLVLRDSMAIALTGTIVGAAIGIGISIVSSNIFYGVAPTDPVSLLRAMTLLVVVTVLACAAPAFRASKADPLEIMRAT